MFYKIVDSYKEGATVAWVNKTHVESIIFIKGERNKIKVMLTSGKEFRADKEYLEELLHDRCISISA